VFHEADVSNPILHDPLFGAFSTDTLCTESTTVNFYGLPVMPLVAQVELLVADETFCGILKLVWSFEIVTNFFPFAPHYVS
jgi:hypothetical protein